MSVLSSTMNRCLAGLLGCSAALPMAMAAEDTASEYWIRVMPAVWAASLNGDVDYSETIAGSPVSLTAESSNDIEIAPMLEASVRLPLLFDVHAGVYSFGTEVNGTAEIPIGLTTITGPASSDLDLLDVYLEVDWRILNLSRAGVSIGLAVHALQTDVQIKSGFDQDLLDESLIIPALAARAHVNPLAGLGFEARLQGMSLSLGDDDVDFLDGAIHAIYRPWEYVGFSLGYRAIIYDIDYDLGSDAAAKVDATLGGFYGGAVFQF